MAWLVRRSDPNALAKLVGRAGVGTLLLGLSLQLVNSLVVSWRWRRMIRAYGAPRDRLPTVGFLFRSNLIANYSALTPVPVADDAVRAVRTRVVFPGAPAAPVMVLLSERIVGLFGLLLLAAVALALRRWPFPPAALRTLEVGTLVASGLCLVVIATPWVLAANPRPEHWVRRLPWARVLSRLPAPTHPAALALPLVLSVVGHFLSCVVIWLLMSRLFADATLGLCVQVQPVVLLLMAVPLTPGGLGQREVAFATLYGLAGVPTAAAVATSLLSFALALAQAGMGGLVLLFERLWARRVGAQP